MVAMINPTFSTPPKETHTIENPDIAKSRYVFSPYLSLKTDRLLCEFNVIEPCAIRHVGKFHYPIRNPKRITDGPGSGEPHEVMHVRKPGYILNDLNEIFGEDLQVKTGFCELPMLMALEPLDNPADMELIRDIQRTLMPRRYPTWKEQVDALEAVNVTDGLYASVQEQMRNAYELASNWGEAYVSTLKIALAQGAAGNTQEGQSRLYQYDKAVCDWLGCATPEIASPLLKQDAKQALDLDVLASILAKSNQETILAVASLLKDAIVRPIEKAESVVPAVETAEATETRRRKTLEEKQEEARRRNG